MRKKIIRIGLILLCMAGICISSTLAETFYVAPDGNDGSSGTQAEPWATLAGARENVRPYLDGSGDIIVYFRGGTYTFSSTVVFGPNDSGAAGQKITYAAYPGETPIFSSLVQVTDWNTYSENIMQANLPGGINHVRYLHDKSENWMERSATAWFNPATQAWDGSPENEHFEPSYQVNKTFCVYPTSFSIPDWAKASQYDLRINSMPWNLHTLAISSVDTGTRTIYVAVPGHYSLNNGLDDLVAEAWIMNSIKGIDSPGEWACLDGVLYLYPKSGIEDIYVPMLTELVRVDAGGDGNNWEGIPVQYINFDGITFTGGDYRAMKADDICVQHDWQMVDVPAGLLRYRNAANCTVTNCTFTKTGGDGVRLDRYCQNMRIENCKFNFLGITAISLIGRGPGYGDVNKNNTIINNHIATPGRIKWDTPAVMIDQSSSNLVKQNYFEDTYLSAIIITGCRPSTIGEIVDGGYQTAINRDMHWMEIHQSVIDLYDTNPMGTAQYFYDYANIIEENTFRDIHIANATMASTTGGFSNGIIYLTGTQQNKTQYIRKNYFFDCDPNGTTNGYDTWVVLGDGWQDYANFDQNMMHNIQSGNGLIESAEIINQNCNAGGSCSATANIIQYSSYTEYQSSIAQNTFYAGNIENGSGGSSSFVDKYKEMYLLLCPDALPGPSPLPGSAEMRATLESKIIQFGGTVPNCPSISTEYTLTTQVNPAGGGTIAIYPDYDTYYQGEIVTLTAMPNTGYPFSGWTGNIPPGQEDNNPITITMDSDKSIKANFTNQIFAPSNFIGHKVVNRSLFRAEYINILTWEKNPLNSNNNIQKYKIYTMEGGLYTLLVELNPNIFEYRHRGMNKDKLYSYTIVAVDINGNEGNRATVIIH